LSILLLNKTKLYPKLVQCWSASQSDNIVGSGIAVTGMIGILPQPNSTCAYFILDYLLSIRITLCFLFVELHVHRESDETENDKNDLVH